MSHFPRALAKTLSYKWIQREPEKLCHSKLCSSTRSVCVRDVLFKSPSKAKPSNLEKQAASVKDCSRAKIIKNPFNVFDMKRRIINFMEKIIPGVNGSEQFFDNLDRRDQAAVKGQISFWPRLLEGWYFEGSKASFKERSFTWNIDLRLYH